MIVEYKQELIRRLKKSKIAVSPASDSPVNYNRDDIQKIIPHRAPFLLIDMITKVDLKGKSIGVQRTVHADDPVFRGHFPKNPLYPGVLQIEMMGQAGLCLSYFINNNSIAITNDGKPVAGVFTRVHNAGYIIPLLPGDKVVVLATLIETDTFLGLIAAQIIKNDQICSHSILELYFT